MQRQQAPEQVIELSEQHRSANYWHVEVEGLGAGCCYCYRVFGPIEPGGHGFRPAKVLVDPCARAIDGWDVYQRAAATGASPNSDRCLKSVVCERDAFDFQAHPRPRHSWQETVIYELHIGGFTKRPDSGCQPRSARNVFRSDRQDPLPKGARGHHDRTATDPSLRSQRRPRWTGQRLGIQPSELVRTTSRIRGGRGPPLALETRCVTWWRPAMTPG